MLIFVHSLYEGLPFFKPTVFMPLEGLHKYLCAQFLKSLFIDPISKYLLSIVYVPSTIIHIGVTAINKTEENPYLHKACINVCVCVCVLKVSMKKTMKILKKSYRGLKLLRYYKEHKSRIMNRIKKVSVLV